MATGLRLEGFGWHTVHSVTLAWAAGRCIGIKGPSGSGKTLFLRALADLDAHTGRAWLDGQACETVPAHVWRRQVGLLPAESAWWHDTVEEHLPDVNAGWLEALGFGREVLAWRIDRLSSGERQRLALLRLLTNRPRVLLLDEPTANLDPVNTERVETFLAGYRRENNPVLVWVGHDSAQLERCCDTVFTMGEAPFPADKPNEPASGEADR